jgi:hypothetical protein
VAYAETVAVLCGAGLITATAAIHLHLYLAGYRHVPRLGVLFLLQAITGLAGGPLLALTRHAVAVLAGAGYMASSAVGLLLSATVGFVGIHDGLNVPWATPSLGIELAGFVILGLSALVLLYRPSADGYMYAKSGHTVSRSEPEDIRTH